MTILRVAQVPRADAVLSKSGERRAGSIAASVGDTLRIEAVRGGLSKACELKLAHRCEEPCDDVKTL